MGVGKQNWLSFVSQTGLHGPAYFANGRNKLEVQNNSDTLLLQWTDHLGFVEGPLLEPDSVGLLLLRTYLVYTGKHGIEI